MTGNILVFIQNTNKWGIFLLKITIMINNTWSRKAQTMCKWTDGRAKFVIEYIIGSNKENLGREKMITWIEISDQKKWIICTFNLYGYIQ